jgi:flavin-dependent dehydrogenase
MLLARQGHRVLMVDRDTFPSDVISTHFIHPFGVDHLARWSVLDRVLESGCPRLTGTEFYADGQREEGPFGETPDGEPVFALAPRRTVIDPILADAAVEAGVEFRQGFSVQDLLRDDDGAVTEQATIVIGADGLHSRVARIVEPEEYARVPTLVCAYYGYWGGLPTEFASFAMEPGFGGALVFPTNDGQSCVAIGWPIERLDEVRADIEGQYHAALKRLIPDFASRLQAPEGGAKLLGMADLPHYIRKPYGPGWALTGDAGYHLDPINGLGMSNAFDQAVWLAEAIDAGLSGERPMDEALAAFQQHRDEAMQERYDGNLAASRGLASAEARAPASH